MSSSAVERKFVYIPGSEVRIPSRRGLGLAQAPVQKRVLAYLKQEAAKGNRPTAREITTHFGWASTFAAYDVLHKLTINGHVKRIEVPRRDRRAYRVWWEPVEAGQ